MPGEVNPKLRELLESYRTKEKIRTKGPLSVVLQVTDELSGHSTVPVAFEETMLTEKGGQVQGLSGSRVSSILQRHGIQRPLAREGGRTSRGSISTVKSYLICLRGIDSQGLFDAEAIEKYWIEKVKEFFAADPFKISQDSAQSIRLVIRDLLNQAVERQKEVPGTQYAGAVLQHLVGAKLELVYGGGCVEHNSFSTSDFQKDRAGDFDIENTAIHVTTAPSEAVLQKCSQNIQQGLRPILITRGGAQVSAAEVMSQSAGIDDRIDILDAEQFLSANLHEHGRFSDAGRKNAMQRLVEEYNCIIDEKETDPSLKIQFRTSR